MPTWRATRGSRKSSAVRSPSARRSRSKAGSAPGAIRRPACRSWRSTTAAAFEALQVVAPQELANYQTDVLRITSGCAVRATGELVASQGKGQSVELRADSIEVVGWVDDPDHYPMQPKRHTMEYLREVAHLRPRTNVIGAVTRVRHTLAMAVHRFFHEHGFFWIHTPIITASDAEGAGQMFKVSTLDFANLPRTPDGKIDFDKDFFGKEARLTVSGQLNVETYCMAMSRVYTFGPTFRAENSNTRRHLAEFWMIEPEIAFADLADDAQLAEDFLKSIFKTLLVERKDDMAFFEKFVDKDCITRLDGDGRVEVRAHGLRRRDRGAREVGREVRVPREVGHRPAERAREVPDRERRSKVRSRSINYPKDIKAFYMRQNDDGKTVAAMDVLAPGIGEIIGGSQREERLDVLDARITEMKLQPAATTAGIATSAATAPCRTPASASASSARSSTRPASRTSAT